MLVSKELVPIAPSPKRCGVINLAVMESSSQPEDYGEIPVRFCGRK